MFLVVDPRKLFVRFAAVKVNYFAFPLTEEAFIVQVFNCIIRARMVIATAFHLR